MAGWTSTALRFGLSLFFAQVATAAASNNTTSLLPSPSHTPTVLTLDVINSIVPTCARQCLLLSIAADFNTTCSDTTDFACLCTHYGKDSSALGELGLSCLYSSVCGSESVKQDTPVYQICNSVPGAVPPTRQTIPGSIFGSTGAGDALPAVTSPADSDGKKLAGAQIAAIILAVVALIVVVATAAILFWFRSRRIKARQLLQDEDDGRALYPSPSNNSLRFTFSDPGTFKSIPSNPRPPSPVREKSSRTSIIRLKDDSNINTPTSTNTSSNNNSNTEHRLPLDGRDQHRPVINHDTIYQLEQESDADLSRAPRYEFAHHQSYTAHHNDSDGVGHFISTQTSAISDANPPARSWPKYYRISPPPSLGQAELALFGNKPQKNADMGRPPVLAPPSSSTSAPNSASAISVPRPPSPPILPPASLISHVAKQISTESRSKHSKPYQIVLQPSKSQRERNERVSGFPSSSRSGSPMQELLDVSRSNSPVPSQTRQGPALSASPLQIGAEFLPPKTSPIIVQNVFTQNRMDNWNLAAQIQAERRKNSPSPVHQLDDIQQRSLQSSRSQSPNIFRAASSTSNRPGPSLSVRKKNLVSQISDAANGGGDGYSRPASPGMRENSSYALLGNSPTPTPGNVAVPASAPTGDRSLAMNWTSRRSPYNTAYNNAGPAPPTTITVETDGTQVKQRSPTFTNAGSVKFPRGPLAIPRQQRELSNIAPSSASQVAPFRTRAVQKRMPPQAGLGSQAFGVSHQSTKSEKPILLTSQSPMQSTARHMAPYPPIPIPVTRYSPPQVDENHDNKPQSTQASSYQPEPGRIDGVRKRNSRDSAKSGAFF